MIRTPITGGVAVVRSALKVHGDARFYGQRREREEDKLVGLELLTEPGAALPEAPWGWARPLPAMAAPGLHASSLRPQQMPHRGGKVRRVMTRMEGDAEFPQCRPRPEGVVRA